MRGEYVAGGGLVGHILHGERGPLQILPQDSLVIRGKILLVHGRPHVGEPPIPSRGVDREPCVAHAQAGVTSLIAVVGRATPVLLEERPKAPLGSIEGAGRIHRAKNVIIGHARVEGGHQAREEIPSAEHLVRGRLCWCVHASIVSDACSSDDEWLIDSARSTMCRAIGGNTNAWKGATDHQYA